MNGANAMIGYPIQLKVRQRLVEGRVIRMAIYHRAKAVEIADSDNSVFYLLFYKKKVITGKRLSSIPRDSFLHTMFESGILLEENNPLIPHLLPLEGVIPVPDTAHMLTKLQQVFTLTEVAEIAGMLDSFVPRRSLSDVIRKIFYHYKREGKRWKAYRILLVLEKLDPGSDWVRQTVQAQEFSKSQQLYAGKIQTILEKDPYVAEKLLFERRKDADSFDLLKHHYENASRTLDLLPLLYEHVLLDPTEESLQTFAQLANQLLPIDEMSSLTEWLYHLTMGNIPALTESHLQQLVDEKRYNEALNVLVSDPRLFESNSNMVIQLIEQCDPHKLAVNEQNESDLLKLIIQSSKGQREKVLEKVIMRLLDIQAPDEIHHMLSDMTPQESPFPIVEELERMAVLKEDTEHQFELGELYYKYDQVDKSIDCFTWEMEMNPTDPNPVLWLSKAYDRKGMVQEAEGYRQLSVEMLKHS